MADIIPVTFSGTKRKKEKAAATDYTLYSPIFITQHPRSWWVFLSAREPKKERKKNPHGASLVHALKVRYGKKNHCSQLPQPWMRSAMSVSPRRISGRHDRPTNVTPERHTNGSEKTAPNMTSSAPSDRLAIRLRSNQSSILGWSGGSGRCPASTPPCSGESRRQFLSENAGGAELFPIDWYGCAQMQMPESSFVSGVRHEGMESSDRAPAEFILRTPSKPFR